MPKGIIILKVCQLVCKPNDSNNSEKEVIKLIENCKDSYIRNAFKNFRDATKDSVYKSNEPNDKIYCTSVKGKKRYINPLVKCDDKFCRIYDVSNQAKEDIENFKNMKMHQYIGFEFNFKPECTEKKRSHVCKIARKKSGIKCAKKMTIFIVIFLTETAASASTTEGTASASARRETSSTS